MGRGVLDNLGGSLEVLKVIQINFKIVLKSIIFTV